jgi:hypothetical protein
LTEDFTAKNVTSLKLFLQILIFYYICFFHS